MKCPRVYVPEPIAGPGELALSGDAANHLRVLRLRAGDPLVLFDGCGGEFTAELLAVDRRAMRVRVLEHRAAERESPLRLTLVQAISKGDRMDWTIQKAVELGVSRIQPVFAERTVVRLQGERLRRKLQHWLGVISSACEQCGRNHLPDLLDPAPLTAIGSLLGQQRLALLLDPADGYTLNHFSVPPDASLALLVGPEGGFSQAELRWARDQGCHPLRLGPRVLRTETAGIAAMAGIQLLWGDLRQP